MIDEHELEQLDLKEIFTIVWRRKWLIVCVFVVAIILSYFISSKMTRIYQTSATVMIKEGGGISDAFGEDLSLFAGRTNKLATYSQLLKTRPIIEKVIKELHLRDPETNEYISFKSLQNNINIRGEKDTNLILITVTYPDPILAKDIANTLVAVFQADNQTMNRADLRNASLFIDEQLNATSGRLSDLEMKLLDYKSAHGVVYPTEQGKAILNKLIQLETARAQSYVELENMQANLKELEANFKGQKKEMVTSKTISSNPEVRELQNRLLGLELDLTGSLAIYTEEHPKVLELRKKTKEVGLRLNLADTEVISSQTEAINPLYHSLQDRIITMQCSIIAGKKTLEIYDKQIESITKELNLLPKEELDLIRLEREGRVTENMYLLLMEKQAEVQIQEAMLTADMVVVSPAIVSNTPIQPKIKVNMAIAGILAIMLGLGIIFLLEFLDVTVKTDKDIMKILGVPVLGLIPDLSTVDYSKGYGRSDIGEEGD